MAEDPTEDESLTQAVRRLNDEITELGILAENAFKETAEALIDQARPLPLHAREAYADAQTRQSESHAHALALLAHASATGDALRRIMELQQTAADFSRIVAHVAALADYAQALDSSADLLLMRAGCSDRTILRRIVRHTYLQVRGAVIVCATRDTARARLLAREDATLDALATTLRTLVEAAIRNTPFQAFPLQQIVLIGAEMEGIGNRVVSICDTILQAL